MKSLYSILPYLVLFKVLHFFRSASIFVWRLPQCRVCPQQAVKTAAVGGAIGYVGWEKLTTDKSVVRIVSDAVIGEPATDALADTAEDVRGLTDKAGEAVGTLSGAVAGIDSKLDGVSNFLRQASSGGGMNMLGNFVRNLGHGNVSGLSIAGLIAAAFLIFGRFGWLGKIAGASSA